MDDLQAHHDAHGGDESPDREDCPICITAFNEAAAYYGAQWKAERGIRESEAIARADLDMPFPTDRELSTAILLRLK
jgi:hypothetical protein